MVEKFAAERPPERPSAALRWFETDAFWRDLRPKIYGHVQKTGAPVEAKAAMILADRAPPGDVIDLCCGNGRHAVELAKMGYRVTAVDLNEGYLDIARAAAASAGVDVAFVQSDIRQFKRTAAFDVALILWNAFGYFEDDDDDIAALIKIREALRPGGRLLIQTNGRESTARKFVRKDWFRIDDVFVLDERWIEDDWARMRTRYIVLGPDGPREHEMSCRLYSPKELTSLLRQAGFESIAIWGGLDGSPYDEKAFELVAVAGRSA